MLLRAVAFLLLLLGTAYPQTAGGLAVHPGHRFFQAGDGSPFFWQGDTAWLLFQKLNRVEAERYLEDRRAKGFNVVQAMVLHAANDKNVYGKPALIANDPARPDPSGYWEHVDWIVDKAAEKGIYVGMVAAWGSIARAGQLNAANVKAYAEFLAKRYRSRANIIWITGGDTQGDREAEVWRTMGRTFRELDPGHLITFHPFGRTQSSTWFHDEPWLDFNMFQSGHRRYDQDTEPGAKGEDNWRYVREDYAKAPPKPTLDGEPSYEGIPQGLHDPTQPYWSAADARRYAYWSVFAGAAGHTYGHNAVMQMHKPDAGAGAYGVRKYWFEAIGDPGAGQMQYLEKLMLSRPYFDRIPDQSLVVGPPGSRYDYVAVTRGKQYLFAYVYTEHPFKLRLGAISGAKVKAWWYDPVDGSATPAGEFANKGDREFKPPRAGSDSVLVLDDASAGFSKPGMR